MTDITAHIEFMTTAFVISAIFFCYSTDDCANPDGIYVYDIAWIIAGWCDFMLVRAMESWMSAILQSLEHTRSGFERVAFILGS